MALDPTKWTFRSDRSIRYVGPAHGTAGANPVTVLELQELIGELQTLALAYPDMTPIRAATHDVVAEVTAVRVESDESGVGIIFEVAV